MSEHRTVSIADQIFAQLERDILSGKYARGEILTEMRLSSELGVSRTPIREAMQRLEQEMLLEETSKGSAVIGITRRDIMDMYDIRLSIEGRCAAMAAKNISDEQLDRMLEITELQKFYLQNSDAEQDNTGKIKNLDSEFHQLLYKGSGSRIYEATLVPMHKKMTKYRMVSIQRAGRAELSVKEHRAIYDALKAHDEELAAERTLIHVKNARDSILETEK